MHIHHTVAGGGARFPRCHLVLLEASKRASRDLALAKASLAKLTRLCFAYSTLCNQRGKLPSSKRCAIRLEPRIAEAPQIFLCGRYGIFICVGATLYSFMRKLKSGAGVIVIALVVAAIFIAGCTSSNSNSGSSPSSTTTALTNNSATAKATSAATKSAVTTVHPTTETAKTTVQPQPSTVSTPTVVKPTPTPTPSPKSTVTPSQSPFHFLS